jgi:hypothetical protein
VGSLGGSNAGVNECYGDVTPVSTYLITPWSGRPSCCTLTIVDRASRTEHRKIFAVVCCVGATFSVISLLWLLRTHYFNATNAGWGDQEQDRHQWLLGWAVRISLALAVICVGAVATFSKRALIAITVGTALSLSSALVASWLPMVSFVLGFPGVVAALYAFGAHSRGGFDVTTYAAVINAVIYSGIGFLLLHKKTLQ